MEWVWNLDYQTQVKNAENTESLLEELDGKLSLKNATITINI